MKKAIVETPFNDLRTFYRKVNVFTHLGEDALETIINATQEFQCEKGDVICKKNRFAQAVYIIKSGFVSEYAMDWNDFNIIVKTGGKGECFGELGVLIGESYFTTVIAEAPTKVLMIPDKVFSKVVWENQCAIKEILVMLSKRLQKSAQKSISYTMFNSEGRLAYILAIMHHEKTHVKYIEVTQESLSLKCGIARQTVSSTLNQWKKKGIVEISRGKIAVLDIHTLTDIAINCAKTF